MFKKELKIFFSAVMFYTRIPCPKWTGHSPEFLNRSTRYFPLIGWIAGLVSYASLYLSLLLFPVEIAVVISMICGILLTGAFHEDGFADVCDGFGGGWTKQKILEIMKDSRIGAYGVTGLALLFFLKFYALKHITVTSIAESTDGIILLLIFVAAHSVSRLTAFSVMFTNRYVREDNESKSKPIAQDYSIREVAGAFFFGLLPMICLTFYRYQFLLALLPLVIARFMLAAYFRKWIGGFTGDCLGATQQVSEVVFYLSVIAVWKYI